MKRRDFFTAAVAAAVAPTSAGAAPRRRPGQAARFKLGCQSGPTTEKRLQFFKRHSVDHICGEPPPPADRAHFTVDELTQFKGLCERHGIALEMITPPFLASTHIDKATRPSIMLGKSPERDRDIEEFQTLIRNCARAGIPAVKYNMNILGVLRTPRTPGRGGTQLSTWRLAEAGDLQRASNRAGRVTADILWERITYFLDRVVPVAAEHKVRIACHPHDPGVPPGFQGVDAVLGTVDGLKRFISIHENPYHGLNFCQGTVSEMLQDPGRELFDVIRHFGTRKKIFNVHFRNIRGKRDDFQEVFPDEGDVDMVRALQVYKEVGYPYMLMPDHVPHHPDDPDHLQAFAFSYGYIRGLIQAAERLG